MANHLTAFVEFLGLPGCGKSFFSHKVAESLSKEGVNIIEPSWELDHLNGKYARVLKKELMAICFSLCNVKKARGLKNIIKKCGYNGVGYQKLKLNILYKAYILNRKYDSIVFFDEGIAQMAVSLAMSEVLTAKDIYKELLQILQIKGSLLNVRIDCSIEESLMNMEQRDSHDSRVEKMSKIEDKKFFLQNFMLECLSLDIKEQLVLPFGFDTNFIVNTIEDYIKKHI